MNTAATTEIDFVKESELIRLAAASQKLTFKDKPKSRQSSVLALETKPVGTFELTQNFLATLEKEGFTFGPGEGERRRNFMYLSGNSNQKGAETFESDSWAWTHQQKKFSLGVYFWLYVSEKYKGVLCVPQVWGNNDGGACHRPTIRKFVRVVAKHFPEAHPIIKKAAAEEECVAVIPWSDIGYGGVESLRALFVERFRNSENVMRLVDSGFSPFDPNPVGFRNTLEPEDRTFVKEIDQLKLIRRWNSQLEKFKDSLR